MKTQVYKVQCPSCGQAIDALTAEWCRCVAKQNTVSCHKCGACLCGADGAKRRDFWRSAPPELRQRHTAAAVSSADEALERIRENSPRVVITDALMPKMDGRELCRAIQSADDRIKVLVMTSLYTAPRYKHEAYKVFGADTYMAKPIPYDDLRTTLQRLISPQAEAADK